MTLLERARDLDEHDPLASFRDRFSLDDDLIYLDGNSLGPPVRSFLDRRALEVVEEWRRELVLGWDRWIDLGLETGDLLAPVIGAGTGEVAVTDQTSVNLYKLAMAAVRTEDSRRIVTESSNFPSDRYVLQAVADAEDVELIVLDDASDLDALTHALGAAPALLALTHVDYRSGAMHDGRRITEVARASGATVLWDLAHSAGAVPVDLEGWGADLAVGCTYKYLNGGPGAPGFLYVRSDRQLSLRQPIEGWFGHVDQFGFHPSFEPAPSVRRFQTGTPPILSLEAARSGIEVTRDAGMAPIRAKSVSLSTLFLDAIAATLADTDTRVVTPADPAARGSHVAVSHPHARSVSSALRDERVIVDHRAPDVIRFGFAPLYTTHGEVVRAVDIMAGILRREAWRDHDEPLSRVT